jgi:RHS repeat-associated protein
MNFCFYYTPVKSMQGVKDNFTYDYLINQKYDKFGAKTEMAYGNYMVTKYMYNPLNLRLDSLVSSLQSNDYFSMGYRYDAKGNVTQLHSKYICFNGNNPITQTFVYDSTDQLTNAQGTYYTTTVTYGNTGKIATYSSPATPNTTFYYPDIQNQTSTIFAPDSSSDGNQTTYYDFGINGSLRRKWHYEGDEFNREERGEYYGFNAFNCMKVYSNNGESYGYYGYDASGERTYKMNLHAMKVLINEELTIKNFMLNDMTLYPNGYINVNRIGEYTKHYYADALRIASKIGSGFSGNLCDSADAIDAIYPNYLTDRSNNQYTEMIEELDTLLIGDEPFGGTIMGIGVDGLSEFCELNWGTTNVQETGLFYYHPDHLGSTGMVTDKDAYIQQGFLYAPFGEIIAEYGWQSPNVPKYAFNAKELDEENGMYYYSARYYAPPTFISRDPLMDEKPWLTPYHYCSNNPINRIDSDGNWDIDVHAYKNRSKGNYGVLILRDRNGNEVYRTVVKTVGTGGRTRNVKNSDTPQGKYKILGYRKTGSGTRYNRESFGPNDLLALDYQVAKGEKETECTFMGVVKKENIKVEKI